MVKPVTAQQREQFSVNMIIQAESGYHVTCSCLQSEGAIGYHVTCSCLQSAGAIDLVMASHVYCTTAVEYC